MNSDFQYTRFVVEHNTTTNKWDVFSEVYKNKRTYKNWVRNFDYRFEALTFIKSLKL